MDYAEYIWKKAEEGLTQEKIAGILGWSVSKVKQYSALNSICKEAWKEIVTTFQNNIKLPVEEEVTEKVTTVTFSERLLREIIQLKHSQQVNKIAKYIALDGICKEAWKMVVATFLKPATESKDGVATEVVATATASNLSCLPATLQEKMNINSSVISIALKLTTIGRKSLL